MTAKSNPLILFMCLYYVYQFPNSSFDTWYNIVLPNGRSCSIQARFIIQLSELKYIAFTFQHRYSFFGCLVTEMPQGFKCLTLFSFIRDHNCSILYVYPFVTLFQWSTETCHSIMHMFQKVRFVFDACTDWSLFKFISSCSYLFLLQLWRLAFILKILKN